MMTTEQMMLDALQRIAALLAEVKGRHNATVAYVLAMEAIAKAEMAPRRPAIREYEAETLG